MRIFTVCNQWNLNSPRPLISTKGELAAKEQNVIYLKRFTLSLTGKLPCNELSKGTRRV